MDQKDEKVVLIHLSISFAVRRSQLMRRTLVRGFNSSSCGQWSQEKYLKQILTSHVYEVASETPLQYAPGLSKDTGNDIYLKREDLQPVFSFKIRGAYNLISEISRRSLEKPKIITCSAGNHAQGVALSAQRLGIDSVIVMPRMTPKIKVDNVKRFGGTVRLIGDSFDDARLAALDLARSDNRTMIHPFDDPYVIAGQGTIGMEIIKQTTNKPLDAIFVCVGGGGLIAGISVYVKALRPDVRIIGVEADDSACMTAALEAKERVVLANVGQFADGAAVRQAGEEPFRLASHFVDEMITVSTDEICAAIKDAFGDTRGILEPAGALAIAGAKKYVEMYNKKGETYAVTASGANMNFDRLRFVAERSQSHEAFISVVIPECPGSFQKLHSLIFPRNVTGFSYRISDPSQAFIAMSFSIEQKTETWTVIEKLNESGFTALDLSENEVAKTHARFLVGGRCSPLVGANEVLLRFEFPERPDALSKFLTALSGRWNVSLFHYRDHGSDIAHVLVGMQVPPKTRKDFYKFLEKVGYVYTHETANPVYQNFLVG